MLMLTGPKLTGARLRVAGLFFPQHSESEKQGGCRPCTHWPQLPASESNRSQFQPGDTTPGSMRRCFDDMFSAEACQQDKLRRELTLTPLTGHDHA